MNIALAGLCCKRRSVSPTGEPVTWTQRTTNFGNYYCVKVRAGSDGYWVVSGGYSASTSYSRVVTNSTSNPTTAWTLNAITSGQFFDAGLDYDGSNWCAPGGAAGFVVSTATNPTSTWSTHSSGIVPTALRYGNSLWVGGGANGQIYTATDPTSTWTSRATVFGTSRIFDIAYDGSTYWVAVSEDNKIGYSTDPTSGFTLIASPPFTDYIRGVAYGNSYWVAVGGAGEIATATDPTGTWTLHGTSPFGGNIHSVCYGASAWVAVGASGELATCGSTPTGTWTLRTSSYGATDTIISVFYYNSYWVSCGYTTGGVAKIATAVPGA